MGTYPLQALPDEKVPRLDPARLAIPQLEPAPQHNSHLPLRRALCWDHFPPSHFTSVLQSPAPGRSRSSGYGGWRLCQVSYSRIDLFFKCLLVMGTSYMTEVNVRADLAERPPSISAGGCRSSAHPKISPLIMMDILARGQRLGNPALCLPPSILR